MSAAATEALSLSDIDANFRRNVSVVMAGKRIRATTVYRALGLSRQAFSARLNGVTRFTLGESVAIASILDVPVDLLAGSTEQVVAHQNWKKLTTTDLHVLDGGQTERRGQANRTHPGQGRLRLLTSVPT